MSARPDVNPTQELGLLRRTLRDLVAVSALPAIWFTYPSQKIVDSLAEALTRILELDFAFVRYVPGGGAERIESACFAHKSSAVLSAGDLGEKLTPWLGDSFAAGGQIPDPRGPGRLRASITRFGFAGDAGILLCASQRDDFPTELERVLLHVAANEAGISIQRGRTDEQRAELLQREQEAHRESLTLNELARELNAELDLQRLVQKVTDAAVQLTGAEFGAFFYNVINEQGEAYVLYALSGAPREAFEHFGLPRNTPLFGPTFRGEAVVRIHDVLADPRYGKVGPHYGMPKGHLPVRAYLAAPVVSRSGTVFGGLFFGHSAPGRFDELSERLILGVAAQAAIAMDNAQLFGQAQQEIIERRNAEERERCARAEAERATRLRDEFLATVSHELRTPLNSVLGWAELLRRAPRDETLRAQAIEAIERGARAQARLIEDLLDMSRIISGKLRLDVQTVELVPLIQVAIDTVLPGAEMKEIRIESVLDPLAGPVKGDPARLQQVFWNLLSNAVKFTPRGGKIQVHLERVNSHVEISFSDNGVGISQEFLPHVFDRFRQADSSTRRLHGGLGLGLSVVKHLVELHGGRVWAKSAGEGQGCTFCVHLPIVIVRQDPAGREHPVSPRGAEALLNYNMTLSGVRVLIVDDDPDACEMLRRVLTECDARVDAVTSAQQALAYLLETTPDVIVSDIGMPHMDGYEFIRQVRANDRDIPAVAVTAFARSEDRIRSIQVGYNMHVAKPLEPLELIAVIAALVRDKL